jgi:hypothetical protein
MASDPNPEDPIVTLPAAQALAGYVLSEEALEVVGDVKLATIREVWMRAWAEAIRWAAKHPQLAMPPMIHLVPQPLPQPPLDPGPVADTAARSGTISGTGGVPPWWKTTASGALTLNQLQGATNTIAFGTDTAPAPSKPLTCPVCGLHTAEHWGGFGPNPHVVRVDLPGHPTGPYCGRCYGAWIAANVPLLEPTPEPGQEDPTDQP